MLVWGSDPWQRSKALRVSLWLEGTVLGVGFMVSRCPRISPPPFYMAISNSSNVYKSFNVQVILHFSQRNWSMCEYFRCVHGRKEPCWWHHHDITRCILVISKMIVNSKRVEFVFISRHLFIYLLYILKIIMGQQCCCTRQTWSLRSWTLLTRMRRTGIHESIGVNKSLWWWKV